MFTALLQIPLDLLEYSIKTSYGIRGCLLLLRQVVFASQEAFSFRPSLEDFDDCIRAIAARPSQLEGAIGSYGDFDLFIGADERLFSEVFQV